MSIFSFTASGQSYYTYFGDNYFRNFPLSGVNNHNYFVGTKFSATQLYYYGPFNTNLGNCGVYSPNIPLSNSASSAVNELRVRPTCPNTPADYIDGVSTFDLVMIQRHLNGLEPFTNGYQKIAADVNKSTSITTADVTMLQQLVLGTTNSFTRNSWEWFEPAYINQFPTTFLYAPWQFCLSAIWPLNGGFGQRTWTGLSRNQISSNMPLYFDFQAVKIGDVRRVNTTPNSYICLPPSYFDSENTESRSIDDKTSLSLTNYKDIKTNDEIEVSISFSTESELCALTLPLSIDDEYLEIKDVQLLNDFHPQYHYSDEFKTLTFLDMSSEQNSNIDVTNGEIVVIKLGVKKNISNVFDHINWEKNFRNIELIDMNAEYASGEVQLLLKNVIPSEERVRVIHSGSTLEFLSTENTNTNVVISSIDGITLYSKDVSVVEGVNFIEIPEMIHSGIYIVTLYHDGKLISEKFVR